MKLSISSLAFSSPEALKNSFNNLNMWGISGIEVAPTKIWPGPIDFRNLDLFDFNKELGNHKLSVSGIQSLLFNRPDLLLFDKSTWKNFFSHLVLLVELSSRLKSQILVFGSPQNRRKGILTSSEANGIAAEFFLTLEPILQKNGVCLAIEPNSSAYGCDWITTYSEAIEFTKLLDSDWIQPQVDTGSQISSGENVLKSFSLTMPAHVHISEFNLEGISSSAFHKDFASHLLSSQYQGWVVLEMLNRKQGIGALDEVSVKNFLESYKGGSIG